MHIPYSKRPVTFIETNTDTDRQTEGGRIVEGCNRNYFEDSQISLDKNKIFRFKQAKPNFHKEILKNDNNFIIHRSYKD